MNRHFFFFVQLLLASLLVIGDVSRSSAQEEFSATTDATRHFQLDYGAVISGLPANADVKIWIPIPASSEQQSVSINSISSPGTIRFENDTEYGNRIGLIEIPAGTTDEVSFKITYDVTRIDAKSFQPKSNLAARDRDKLVAANLLVPVNGRPLELIAKTGFNSDEIETGRKIYTTVLGHLNYDKTKPGYGNGDVLWACDSRTGNCTDFHSLFMSLMRSRRIPTRFEIGFSVPDSPEGGTLAGYHCWAWFLANDRQWIPVDISEADKHPELKDYYFGNLTADRVTFSTGRDIPLFGGSTAKLNYFVYPYVEVNGQPFAIEKIQNDFSWKSLPSLGHAD